MGIDAPRYPDVDSSDLRRAAKAYRELATALSVAVARGFDALRPAVRELHAITDDQATSGMDE